MKTAVPPLKDLDALHKQGSVAFDDHFSSSTSSSNSSLHSFLAGDLDIGSVGNESLNSSVSLSSDAQDHDNRTEDGGEGGRKGAAPEAHAARHPLMQRLLRRRCKDVRSKHITRRMEERKARLDALYAATRVSYFDKTSEVRFSIMNECHCVRDFVLRFILTLEEERLPWWTDFADPKKMRLPRRMKEVMLRLNLNIPYYASNYVEVFYVLTLPFLLFYNPVFLALFVMCCYFIHAASARKRVANEYGAAVMILGRAVPYRLIGHIMVALMFIDIAFFRGLRTIGAVLLLNGAVIIPHAIWRRPTFFDDEELEKCRPKLVQYIITVVVALFAYLEGDTGGCEACGFHTAQRRRAKLGLPVLKLEDDPYIHA